MFAAFSYADATAGINKEDLPEKESII